MSLNYNECPTRRHKTGALTRDSYQFALFLPFYFVQEVLRVSLFQTSGTKYVFQTLQMASLHRRGHRFSCDGVTAFCSVCAFHGT